MKDKEKEMVRSRHGKDVTEIPVALDGVAIYVPESSPIQSLTKAQLKAIYTGTITNWNDVGGKDQRIVAYSRENNSGTYVFFKEHVLEMKILRAISRRCREQPLWSMLFPRILLRWAMAESPMPRHPSCGD